MALRIVLAWCFALVASLAWSVTGCGGGGSYDPGETTAAACQDGTDNDSDGDVDCDDTDCEGFVFCLPDTEVTAVECQNDRDDDGDGATDCGDSGCEGFVFCQGTTEDSAGTCQNGVDDDSDGQTDCDDPECQGFLFCQGATEDTSDLCQNGLDDDGDGDTDCDDTDCGLFSVCDLAGEESPSDCQDLIDNDGDGMIDCFDAGCQGYVFCMQSTETSSTSCQDGQDNDRDGLIDCSDPDCLGFVFCSGPGESSDVACTDGTDNDGDSLVDCDDPGCWPFGFCQHYHGYPLIDSWGETFDGIERPALLYDEAVAVCTALGGRLPTVTELWRNNANTGTGDLSDDLAGNPLWTQIASAAVANRVSVRLSDGAISYTDEATPRKFRCVWADAQGLGFDAARCHGGPQTPCWSFDRFWNVDMEDRPAIDYVAATNECAFYGASIPVVEEWGRMIHAGIPDGQDVWVWAADAMYWFDGWFGMALVRWLDEDKDHWHYSNADTWGAVSLGTNNRAFRCIGLESPASFPAPDVPCEAACFDLGARRSQIKADDTDRQPLRVSEAMTVCRAAGGELPNLAEATELLHAGWPNGTDDWQWLANPLYWWSNNYGMGLFRWLDVGLPSWSFVSGTGERSLAADLRAFRCVYRPSGPALPVCNPDEVVGFSGGAFLCAPGTPGTSGGQAHVLEIVDDFGNAWDGLQRDLATFAEAVATCEAAGGRLPTASEIFAVRFAGNPHDPIGDVNSTSPLWTSTHTSLTGYRVLVAVSDGSSSQADELGASQYFRCVWPASQGEVLAASNCYGPPGDPCFVADPITADQYDRVAVDMAGAIEECQAVGGRLPDLRELAGLIHAGWANGSDNWLWLGESMYWWDIGYGYALAKWSGAGDGTWEYSNPNSGALSYSVDFRNFRCVYSSRLR